LKLIDKVFGSARLNPLDRTNLVKGVKMSKKIDDLLNNVFPDDLYSKMPDSVDRGQFANLVISTAKSMNDYGDFLSKSGYDLQEMRDEIADPDQDYPYTREKWTLVNDLFLWASNDLGVLAASLIDNRSDGREISNYLFPVLDGYVSSAIYWAFHMVMDYVGAECLFTQCSNGIISAHIWEPSNEVYA